MALLPVPSTTSTASSTSKSIILNSQSVAANTTLYTVPAGKTFQGQLVMGYTTNRIMVNGYSAYYYGGNGPTYGVIPVTFPAGTVISTTDYNYWWIIGVES